MPPPSAAELQRAAQVVLSQQAARQAPLEALLARQLVAFFDRSKPRGEPSGLLRQGTAWRSLRAPGPTPVAATTPTCRTAAPPTFRRPAPTFATRPPV